MSFTPSWDSVWVTPRISAAFPSLFPSTFHRLWEPSSESNTREVGAFPVLWVGMQQNKAKLQQFLTFLFPTYLLDDFNEVCSHDLSLFHSSLSEDVYHCQLLLM